MAATTASGVIATPSVTFSDHVRELRKRLLWCIVALGACAGIGFALHKPIIFWIQHPWQAPLYYFNPAGSFNFVLKVSFFAGVMAALPILTYQVIRFIEPALPIKIKSFTMMRLIFTSLILAVGGAAFAFYVLVPVSLKFFAGYATGTVKPLLSAEEYLNFLISCLATFAVLFQIPLVIMFINRVKPMRPNKILRYQRHIIVGAFVLAVVLPFTYDPVSQFAMAVPVVFLFYLSVIMLWLTNRNRSFVQIHLPLTPLTLTDEEAAELAKPLTRRERATPSRRPVLDGLRVPH